MKKTFFAVLMIALFAIVAMAQTTVNYSITKHNIEGDRLLEWTPVCDSAAAQWSNDFAIGNVYDVAGNLDVSAYVTQSFTAGKTPATKIFHYVCYGDPSVAANWFVADTLFASATNTTVPTAASGYTLNGKFAPHNKFYALADANAVTVKLYVYFVKQQMF